jgi:tol-pal system protein YbgF
MKTWIVFFLAFILLVSMPGYSIRKDTKLILDQLQKMEVSLKNLEDKVTTIAAETSTMAQKIKLIEDKVNAITRNQADVGQNKESLLLSLQFIKEEINELKNSINKVNDRLVSLPTAAAPPEAASTTGELPQRDSTIQSPESIYYTAYSDYIKKNYQLAVEGFKQFIQLYPQNGLADNALYWIGECYYSQKMFQDAVTTFTELITNYSDGDKIPDAILKKGYALIEMGKQAEGITVLKELVSRFPLSEEASLAQQKIKEVTD